MESQTYVRGGTQPLIGNIDTVSAETYSDYLSYGKVDKDMDGTYDYIEISDCDKSVETIEIPSEIEGLPVTSIGYQAFSYCESLTSIEIPNSVTSIENGAFSGCSSLTNIVIPDSVTSIGSGAFYNCENLTSIEVSENNSNYSSIDGVLFNKDKTELIFFPKGSKITEYKIPGSVTSIRNFAFTGCLGLTSITIPESVISIGEEMFSGCTNLTSIEIPDSVTSIGGGTFYGCSALTNIVITDSITSIEKATYHSCSGLTSIEIPDNVTSIGVQAFFDCSGLTSITIKNPECEIADDNTTISNNHIDNIGYYNGVIRGYENSTAQAYAEKYGYKFESIGEDTPVSGDVDGDGKATLYDAIIVCKCMIGAKDVTEEQKKYADVNGDGRIDLYDAIYVAECMIGKHKD